MDGKIQLYKYMLDNGLLKERKPEYDKIIEDEGKRQSFFTWKDSLCIDDREQFERAFGKD